MKKIRLLTSAEDTVLCELKCGSDISLNTLCAIKGKKTSTHTSHTIQQNLVAKDKGLSLFIARGGSLVPVRGINRDQYSTELHVPRAGDQCSAERHVPRAGGIGPG
jgi:hypothetical protein